MGTVFSFDVRGGEPGAVQAALQEAIAGLHRVNEVFSTYRDDSQVSRLARGELTVEQCAPEVAEVLALGAEAERVSDGWFSMRYEGRLDPNGIVKGWAAERADRQLAAARARYAGDPYIEVDTAMMQRRLAKGDKNALERIDREIVGIWTKAAEAATGLQKLGHLTKAVDYARDHGQTDLLAAATTAGRAPSPPSRSSR